MLQLEGRLTEARKKLPEGGIFSSGPATEGKTDLRDGLTQRGLLHQQEKQTTTD